MNTTDKWAIHRLLALQTDSRLQLIRHAPQKIILMGADADESRRLLKHRYPKAVFDEYDSRADFLQAAAQVRRKGLLRKPNVTQYCQSLTLPLPESTADMLWSNLGLITEKSPMPVFKNWAYALKPHGLLFFTHFGINSLRSLIGCLKEYGISVKTPMLFDMHDIGDMLLNHFYDPVMDTAELALNYRHAETFWQDMETLGLWASLDISDSAAAYTAVNNMFADNGMGTVTLETVYGHAVKKPLSSGSQPIKFYSRQ